MMRKVSHVLLALCLAPSLAFTQEARNSSGNGSLLGRTEGLSGRLAALYFFFLR